MHAVRTIGKPGIAGGHNILPSLVSGTGEGDKDRDQGQMSETAGLAAGPSTASTTAGRKGLPHPTMAAQNKHEPSANGC
jgi:hypothetical protein